MLNVPITFNYPSNDMVFCSPEKLGKLRRSAVLQILWLLGDDIIIIIRSIKNSAAAARICVFDGDGGPTEGRAPENADRPTAGARKRLPLPLPYGAPVYHLMA